MLDGRQIVAVSDNIAELSCVSELALQFNALATIPAGVFSLTRLESINLSNNRLVAIPREIGRLTALRVLWLSHNLIDALPRELGQLRALTQLWLPDNKLASLPSELCHLQQLRHLFAMRNALTWLPLSLDRLPATTMIFLNGNPLPIPVGDESNLNDARPRLLDIFAATTALSMIRSEATTLALGLADLSLPALVTLEIIDAAFPNSIAMHLKWSLITAVKHFHQRH